jgi:hypothetical protein
MRLKSFATLCFLAFLGDCQGEAFATAKQGKPQRIAMVPPIQMGAGSVQIDGGSKQDPDNWRATLKFLYANNLTCTSTIVGEHAVITAAHCISDGASYSVDLGATGTFELSCERNPKYVRKTLGGDVAMCFSATSLPNSGGFENLDLNSPIAAGTMLFLLGYGCRSVVTLDGSGQLYGGSSNVLKLPTAKDDHLLTKGGVVICPGDSGGAAYLLAVEDHPVNPRSVVGINSSYDVSVRTSGITTFSGTTRDFILDWKKAKETTICGLDPNAVGCHDRFTP